MQCAFPSSMCFREEVWLGCTCVRSPLYHAALQGVCSTDRSAPCCSVGDILKFGQSSRMFILGGPAELMPEEGLSRPQRQHLAALEVQLLPQRGQVEVYGVKWEIYTWRAPSTTPAPLVELMLEQSP